MSHENIYYGWCDESRYNKGRYRSIAMISHSEDIKEELISSLNNVLNNHSKKEIKLSQLKSDISRDTIKECLDILFSLLQKYKIMTKLRVDILIWNIEDSRHLIQGRDDIENLQRMYYHLFKNVLVNRWKGGKWRIFTDENSSIEWNSIKHFLDKIKSDFKILELQEMNSKDNVLIQLSDIFAGLGSYSWENYEKYITWIIRSKKQKTLMASQEINLSNKEEYIFQVVDYLLKKRATLKNGQEHLLYEYTKKEGLKTTDPSFPINFWLYIPQTNEDKAPTKKRIFKKRKDKSLYKFNN